MGRLTGKKPKKKKKTINNYYLSNFTINMGVLRRIGFKRDNKSIGNGGHFSSLNANKGFTGLQESAATVSTWNDSSNSLESNGWKSSNRILWNSNNRKEGKKDTSLCNNDRKRNSKTNNKNNNLPKALYIASGHVLVNNARAENDLVPLRRRRSLDTI